MAGTLAACVVEKEDSEPHASDVIPSEDVVPSGIENTDDTQSDEGDSGKDTVILEADNKYMEIGSIDISQCEYEDGWFSGHIYFIQRTTQAYVDEYDDYFYRQVYIGFYNTQGELVSEEIAQNNYIYSREYVSEEDEYVLFATSKEVVEAKVLKIAIKKP